LEKLPHVKGSLAGTLFVLEPWQKYDVIYPLFGWVTDNERQLRRFKIAYNEMARKTGKSFLVSGIGLYMTFFDGEPGAETYCIATKKDQAKIVWDGANDMKNRTALRSRIITSYSMMKYKSCVFAPLGADSKTLDGLSTHLGIVDEYHSHKNSHLYDVIKSSTGARDNSMMIIITTAGFNKQSACYDERTYSEKILRGQLKNENYFAFIASIDKKDDPFDPRTWKKANPNLGISNSIEDFTIASKEAKQKGGQTLVEFLTKRLNVWTNVSDVWIKDDDFPVDEKDLFSEEDLIGAECYGGLDLSKTSDLTAYALVFPQPDGKFKTIVRSFVPEKSYEDRTGGDNVYKKFVDQGTLIVTPGNVIDYNIILESIRDDMEKFEVREMAYDRYMSAQIITELTNDGLECIPFGQGYVSMSAPTKMIETLILEKKLHHNNDALLRWQLSNVLIDYDPAGNAKMTKATSKAQTGGSGNRGSNSKIDAWIAIAMGLGRASLNMYYEEEYTGVYLI
jgi:phage terminase large subunit-like protein